MPKQKKFSVKSLLQKMLKKIKKDPEQERFLKDLISLINPDACFNKTQMDWFQNNFKDMYNEIQYDDHVAMFSIALWINSCR